jgi:Ca-activated chloride channel family protein
MFILDASGSMRDEMDGKEKFQIVKDVVESMVRKLPEDSLVGLRVYGHRKGALDEGADLDSELVIPVGPLNPETFVSRVKALKCKGMTPLTYSLDEAIKDVSGASPEAEVITVLLTDGGETTRGAKPPEAAARLAASRKGMKVHVVGFDIYDDDWREQLEKTAASGHGTYFHARKAGDLLNALSLAAVGTEEYTVLDPSRREVLRGKIGDHHRLPEGQYVFSLDVGGKREERTLWINTEVSSHVSVAPSKLRAK